MKLISLTDQEYDNLIKSNSLDDFLRFKETLANSQVSESQINNSLATVKDHYSKVVIRILSLNEYNKYIKDGTADGSITKDNTNTWHHPHNIRATAYVYKSSEHAIGKWPSNTYTVNNSIVYNLKTTWVNGGIYNFNSPQTVKDYLEHIQDNNSNNIIAFYPKGGYIEFIVGLWTYGTTSGAFITSITLYKNTMNKNAIVDNHSLTLSGRPPGDGYNTSGTIYFNADLCFRPVFQIKDNNKSINLYN